MSGKDNYFIGMTGLIAALLAAHIIGDLFLRLDAWLGIWGTIPGYLIHVLIWAGLISIVLAVYKQFTFPKFIFLYLTHFIIDSNKLHLFAFGRTEGYVIDQILHMISIILVLIWPGIIMLLRKKAHP